MQNVSSSYLLEIKKPSRSFECKVTIRDNIYTNADIINITIEDVQPSDGFSIGAAVSKSLELTLSTNNTIYSNSIVKVEIGLNVGSKIEYVLMGYFNIDDIEKTDYSIKLTCFDNMMKFEKPYFSKLGKTASLKNIVNELSQITGVEFTGSLPSYNLNKLEGFTCREVLGFISSLCAGNAYITRDGKFTINTLKTIDYSITDENYIDLKTEENVYKIGAVTCKINEKELTKGTLSNSSMEVAFENPWVNDSILTDIYNKLKSIEYVGYSMKWQGDLSLDVGDIISLTDHKGVKRNIPILSQKFSYNGGLTSDIGAKGESKNKNEFNSTGNLSNKVNRVVTELLIVNEALINKADIEELKAVNATINNLLAENVTITGKLNAIEGEFGTLKANVGVIDKLTVTHTAQINELEANKASITQLEAVSAKIGTVEAEVGKIQTLVNGNLSSENIQAGGITSDKLTIANGFITNAMIANLDVSKVNAGDISTNKFRIVSDSGKMLIADNTIQIKDNNRVRVQIGKDASNDYSMYVWDSSGKLMFDATGLKSDGIKNKIIRDDMISDSANITGSKINISSLITEINKDTNTSVIKSSKVQLDTVGQTLEVAFNSLKSNVDNIEIGGKNLLISSKLTTYAPHNSLEKTTTGTDRIVSKWNPTYTGKTFTLKNTANKPLSGVHTFSGFIKVNGEIPATPYFQNISTYYSGVIENYYDTTTGYFRIVQNQGGTSTWIIHASTTRTSCSEDIVEITKAKIEKGNKATDWTPAPEDVQGQIDTVKKITESNSTTISVMQGQISTAINNTQIVKDGQTILLKDDYNRTVQTVNSMNSTIGSHTTKINEHTGKLTDVETRVNTVERDLNGITVRVSSTEKNVTKVTNTANDANSNATNALNIANSANSKIDELEIGGRNLILNTKDEWTDISVDMWHGQVVKRRHCSEYGLKPGDEITFGIDINPVVKTALAARIDFYSGATGDTGKIVKVSSIIITKGNPGRSYITTTIPKDSPYIWLALQNGKTSTETTTTAEKTKAPKLEKGNKPTDWTPSPEDIDSNIKDVSDALGSLDTSIKEAFGDDIINDSEAKAIDSNIQVLTNEKADIDREYSSIYGNAKLGGTAKTNLSSAKTAYDSAHASLISGINTATSDKKITDAERNSVNSFFSTYRSKLADFKQRMQEALDYISTKKIDGLEIGGRNIVKDTGTSKSIIGTGTTNRTGCTYHFTVPYLTDIKGKELIVVFDWKYEGENPSGTFYMQTGEPQYGTVTSVQTISSTNTSGTIKKIWKPTMEKDTKSVYIRTDNMVGTFTMSNLRVYFGTKDIGWTPAPEDVQTQIDTNKTEISSTKSKVSTIETNLTSITSRVSDVENTQTTVDGKVTSLQTRMKSAEQKLTKEGLTTIISNHYTTSNDVNGIVTSKGYQTHSQVQQAVDKLQAKFTANGGYNKLYNSAFLTGDLRNWSNLGTCTRTVTSSTTSGFAKCLKIVADGASQGVYQIVDNLVAGKQYTLSALVKATSGKTGIQVYHDDKYLSSYTNTGEKYQVLSITFKAATTTASIRLGTLSGGTSGTYYYTGVLLTEGELVEPWSPHPSEVYDGITTIDKDGITVTSSNVKSKTSMSANGFKITKTDTNEDVFKVNSNGRLLLDGEFTTHNGTRKSGYFGSDQIKFYNWWSDSNEAIAYFYGGKTSANKRSADVVGKDVVSLGVGDPGSGTKVLEGSSSTLNIYKDTNFNNWKLKDVNSINEDIAKSTFIEKIVIRSNQVNTNHDGGNLNLNYWRGYNAPTSVVTKVCNGNNDGSRGTLHCQDFKAYGTKNACVKASVGYVDINAYETCDYYFGDIGETILDSEGYSYVYIDSLFSETVNTQRKYQVFLSVYGEGIANVIERYPTHFIIKGTPGIEIGYEIKAKRKGYEDYRLEREVNSWMKGREHGLDIDYTREKENFNNSIVNKIEDSIDLDNTQLVEFVDRSTAEFVENKDLMEIIEEDLNYESIN